MNKFLKLSSGFCFSLALALTLLFASATLHPAYAEDLTSKIKSGSNLPTNITAQQMRYDANSQRVVFEKDVKVRRPDFDLDSNKLTILFKKNPQKPASQETQEATDDPLSTMGAGDIDQLIAEGKVVMVRDGRTGTCSKVTYYVDKELIVMEGNPVLTEGKNSVSGQKINFYIRENRSEVIGGANAPVKVQFSSPKSNEGF